MAIGLLKQWFDGMAEELGLLPLEAADVPPVEIEFRGFPMPQPQMMGVTVNG